MRILAYVTNGTDQQTQAVIDAGFIQIFYGILRSPDTDKRIVKEVLWILSNISIGPPEQIQAALIDNNQYGVITKWTNSEHIEIKKEAVWTICNSTKNATAEQIKYFVDNGMLEMFNDLLHLTQRDEILLTILEALNWVFQKASYDAMNDHNPYIEKTLGIGMDEKLEQLQRHKNAKVYENALKIIETHYEIDEEF